MEDRWAAPLVLIPPCPTAQPVCASAKCTPARVLWVSLFCTCQVVPPSCVATIVPANPTAQPVRAIP
jgi:hypothetical protein